MPLQGSVIAYLIWRHVGVASLAGVFLMTLQTIPVQGNNKKFMKTLPIITINYRVRTIFSLLWKNYVDIALESRYQNGRKSIADE